MELTIIMPTKQKAKKIQDELRKINKTIWVRLANPKSSIRHNYQIFPRRIKGKKTAFTSGEKKAIIKGLKKYNPVDCMWREMKPENYRILFNGNQLDFANAENIIGKELISSIVFERAS